MTKKVLVTFGDSWTYGSELPEDVRTDYVYGKLLMRLMEYDEHINLAKPASGIGEMVVALDKFLTSPSFSEENQYFFVFGVTTSTRSLGYSNRLKEWFEILPVETYATVKKDISKFLIANVSDRTYQCTNANIYLAALQMACKSRCIKFLMFSVFESLDYDNDGGKSLVDKTYFYKFGEPISEELGYPKYDTKRGYFGLCEILKTSQNRYVMPNDSHPNAQGHEYLANALYRWMLLHLDH